MINSYIETYSGIKFDLLDINSDQILIEDIAHSLSMQVRYTGHVKQFYSIAEHSLLVTDLVKPEYELYALLHDASEAYLSDIASPLKALLPDYQEIEKRVQHAIIMKFVGNFTVPECVKRADLVALKIESSYLMQSGGDNWSVFENLDSLPVNNYKLNLYDQQTAKTEFLQRFNKLYGN